jgi:hypothetical protein
MFSFWAIYVAVVLAMAGASMMIMAATVDAHERKHGWRHAKEDFKGIVSMRYCPNSVVHNWKLQTGESYLILVSHNAIHYMEGTCEDLE